MGLFSEKGIGVPEDAASAADWYQKAASTGDPQAQNNLGLLYVNGSGVAQNFAIAAELFQGRRTRETCTP